MKAAHQVGLVTGASRGLGEVIAGVLARRGYDLVTPLSLMDPFTMIAQIAANRHSTNHLNFGGPQTPTTVNV